MTSYTISEANRMDKGNFVQAFGAVFEETPQIAERTWAAKPFKGIEDLHQKMVSAVEGGMTHDEKLKLIKSHPELGAKGKMAVASVQEQASAGLNQIAQEEQQQIYQLNAAYQEKFGFPFVMAVKGQSLKNILTGLETRLSNSVENEMVRSLSEIYKIARFRLDDLLID